MKEIEKLQELNACNEAIVWAETQPNWETLWNNCERGDWMLWLLGKLSKGPRSKGRKQLVLTACECARLSLKYIPKGEKRPLIAIETAEKWANGDSSVSLQNVRDAADAAAYYAYAAYAADAADAAYAAADAAADAADADADAAYADAAEKIIRFTTRLIKAYRKKK